MVEGESFCLCFSFFLPPESAGQQWRGFEDRTGHLLQSCGGWEGKPPRGGREFSGHCLAPAGALWAAFTKSSPASTVCSSSLVPSSCVGAGVKWRAGAGALADQSREEKCGGGAVDDDREGS